MLRGFNSAGEHAASPHFKTTHAPLPEYEITGRPSRPTAMEVLTAVKPVSTALRVLPDEQLALPHLATFRSLLVALMYAITGKPSAPMAMDVYLPTLPPVSTDVTVLPAVHAALPHLATFKSPLVAS